MKQFVVALFCSLFFTSVTFAATATVNGITWYYSVSNGEASISGTSKEDGAITVPEILGGYPVTSIGDDAFYGRSGLTSVTIPSGVTSIGGSAFENCLRLTSVTIPSSVTHIGKDAFDGCSKLTSVHISDIAAWCRISFSNDIANPFYYAKDLYLNGKLVSDLVIPSSVTTIWDYAFRGCSGLTSVTIPSSVTKIEDYAFAGCSGLTSVTIPSSVTFIGNKAFSGCNKLTSVHISDIAAWCRISFYNDIANPFYYAKDLYLNGKLVSDLVIPEGVTSLASYLFYRCSSINTLEISSSVTGIWENAFRGGNLSWVKFRGPPPSASNIAFTENSYILGSYPAAYAAEWEAVLDANRRWRGLRLSETPQLTPLTRDFEASGGAGAIATTGSEGGSWSASTSSTWITLNATSGIMGYPVAYVVDINTDVETRIGQIVVNGEIHTVTQKGIGATIETSDGIFESKGGTGSVLVKAQTQSAWSTRSNSDWITVTPSSGKGEGIVTYTVAPFNEVTTRQGSLTVAGNTVEVFQYGRRMKLEATSQSCDWHTHVIPITVNALAITEWTVTPNASWISVVDGGNGKGGDLVTIAIAENPSYVVRTGTVTIGTETFTVTQSGRTELAFAVSPEKSTASVNGANGIIAVSATPDLPWSASSQVDWVTIYSSTASGAGNGNVVYTVSPQTTLKDRSGTITVTPDAKSGMLARTHTVTQPAAEVALSLMSYEFEASGETCAVAVSLADIVTWEIVESLDWLSVDGATSRVGPSQVVLQASANETIYPRSGTVKIAEKTFTVTQKGRGVEVEYETKLFGTDGGSESISIHPDGNVSWTAVASDPTWITIFQGDSGTGDGEIMYIISPYTGDGSARTGTITVGDKVVYITQRAYDLSIEPNGTIVTGNNGEGEFGVSASITDVWTAIVTEPWITIVEGYDAGTGNGTVRFIYTENNTGKARTGKIIVSGEVYTIQQAARVMVNITATAEHGGTVSGGGSYSSGSEVTLTATPNEGYAFSHWIGDVESMQNPLVLQAVGAISMSAVFEPLPIVLEPVVSSEEGVTLTWNNLAWATTYRIYRGVTSVPSSAEVLVEIPNTGFCTYFDDSGEVDVLHWYWIEAEGVEDSVMSDPMTGKKKKPVVISNIIYDNLRGATHTNPTTYEEGTLVTFANPSAVTGYVFAGWTPEQITGEMTGNQTITAAWTPITYSIAYAANGGSGTMEQTPATYDASATIATNAFVYEGYLFKGWATTADGEVVYAGGESVSNLTPVQNGVVTLYAIWEVVETPDEPDSDEPTVHTPPSWNVSNYQNNMVVYAQVKDITTGAFIETAGSLLGAFDANGVCRGVIGLLDIGLEHPVYQLTVCSDETSGEVLTLKVWDAATGEIAELSDKVTFVSDTEIGLLWKPVVYEIGLKALAMTLNPGWNWCSINVAMPEGTTLSDFFTDWTPQNGDQVKAGTQTATYFNGAWRPTDFVMQPGMMYLIKNGTDAAVTTTVMGTPAKVDETIDIATGWNWVGYTGAEPIAVANAFVDNSMFANGDVLKSNAASATFYNGAWRGVLTLTPGVGYKLKVASGATIQYAQPTDTASVMAAPVAMMASTEAPDWKVSNYQYNMVVYASIQNAQGVSLEADGNLLAAFDANGVCRGVIDPLDIGIGVKVYQLTVCSDEATESGLTLKLWDAATSTIYDVNGTIDFKSDTEIGLLWEPQVYTVVETAVKFDVAANVFGDGTVTGAGAYEAGETVTLVATPAEGYVFCGWGATPVSMEATHSFTMPEEAVSVTAYFAPAAALNNYVAGQGLVSADEVDAKIQAHIAENNLKTPEEVEAAIEAHVASNGLLTPAQANQQTQDYIVANKLKSEQEVAAAIAQAIEEYVSSNGLLTPEEAEQLVNDYIADNNLMSKDEAKQELLDADEVFTADEMKALAFGAPVIQVKNGKATVSIQVKRASELDGEWEVVENGEVSVEITPKAGEKAGFYKFVVSDEQ